MKLLGGGVKTCIKIVLNNKSNHKTCVLFHVLRTSSTLSATTVGRSRESLSSGKTASRQWLNILSSAHWLLSYLLTVRNKGKLVSL